MSLQHYSEYIILVDHFSESEMDEKLIASYRGHSKPKGAALILAVVLVVIMFVIGTFVLELAAHARLQSIRTVQQISARSAADAGLSEAERIAMALYASGSLNDANLPSAPRTSMASTYGSAEFESTTFYDVNNHAYQIDSTGYAGNA